MSPHGVDLPVVYLRAGEIYLSREPAVVLTVLGSCITVTMHHRRRRFGAVCHAMLPRCATRSGCSGTCVESGRFVECSVERMVRWFVQNRACAPDDLEVKIFGGADMFGGGSLRGRALSVGRLNIDAAVRALAARGLRIESMDVGGTQGRKIFVNTATGEVLLKRLQSSALFVRAGEQQ